MRPVRFAVPILLALAVVAPAHAAKPPAKPTGLKAFLLRASERAAHEFPRTPSFAWKPVSGATSYEFELSTSPRFNESAIVWERRDLTVPAASLDVSLPWITGKPYALYARARAISRFGSSPWSAGYGVNIRWANLAEQLPAPAGLVRWTPIEGATWYEILFRNTPRNPKRIVSSTNVADLREYYTFNPIWSSGVVEWRVRAVRKLYGEIPNGLPAVQYGAWSPVFASFQPPVFAGAHTLGAALSDEWSDASTQKAHELTPAFAFTTTGTGAYNVDEAGFGLNGQPTGLSRIYIFTDRDCVNVVFRGSVVGSPAYAPRMSGALALPPDTTAITAARSSLLTDGPQGTAWAPDAEKIKASEEEGGAGGATAKVDLWDTHWPTGGYYWTVVPVDVRDNRDSSGTSVEYTDTVLPQDLCAAGFVQTFGKRAKPTVIAAGAPYASGLSNGRLLAAVRLRPSFARSPLVAWKPALGADEYEIQWGRKAKPFAAEGTLTTGATSAMLCAPTTQKGGPQPGPTPPPASGQPPASGAPASGSTPSASATPPAAPSCAPLSPGTWYYRVRGLNYALKKRPGMSWSDVVELRIAKPTFAVVSR